MRALDNIVLTCTSDNSLRAGFSSRKVFIVLDLRSYYESDSSDWLSWLAARSRKGQVLGSKPGWER